MQSTENVIFHERTHRPPAEYPTRYVINHGVPNPLTCRHKHRCAGHGEPPSPQPAEHKLSAKEYRQKSEQPQWEFIDWCGQLVRALQPFPGASAIIDQVVADCKRRSPA